MFLRAGLEAIYDEYQYGMTERLLRKLKWEEGDYERLEKVNRIVGYKSVRMILENKYGI